MPSDTFNFFNSFPEQLAEKKMDLSADTVTVALCASTAAPVASNAWLSNLTTVANASNLSDANVTISDSAYSGSTYTLKLTDKVLTASGGSVGAFQYVVLYDNTTTNDPLIGWLDYGSSITLADTETLTLDFDPTNGVLKITFTNS
jgi:hypothetical protein